MRLFNWLSSLFHQHHENPDTNIGAVLLMLCAVDADALDRASELQKEHPSKKLGQILVELNEITEQDLELALRLQKNLRNGKAAYAMAKIANRQAERGRLHQPTKPAHV